MPTGKNGARTRQPSRDSSNNSKKPAKTALDFSFLKPPIPDTKRSTQMTFLK